MKRSKLLHPTTRTGSVQSLICMMTEGDAVGKMRVFGNNSTTTVASGLRVHRPACKTIVYGRGQSCSAKPAEMPRLLYANDKSNSLFTESGVLSSNYPTVDSDIVYIINIFYLHKLASSHCKILDIYRDFRFKRE